MKKVLLILLSFLLTDICMAGPHTVQRGESFASIAKLYNVSLDSVLKANIGIKPYVGMVVEVPDTRLVYDLGGSTLFRKFFNLQGKRSSKGAKAYSHGYNIQKKRASGNKHHNTERIKIIKYYEQAISYGNLYALYQMGLYKIYGDFCDEQSRALRYNQKIDSINFKTVLNIFR